MCSTSGWPPKCGSSDALPGSRLPRFLFVSRSAAFVEPAAVSVGTCPRQGGVRSTLVSLAPPPGVRNVLIPRSLSHARRAPPFGVEASGRRALQSGSERARETTRSGSFLTGARHDGEHESSSTPSPTPSSRSTARKRPSGSKVAGVRTSGASSPSGASRSRKAGGSSGSRTCWSFGRFATRSTG